MYMKFGKLFDLFNPAFLFKERNSVLSVVGDGAGWALDHEASELVRVMKNANYNAAVTRSPAILHPAFFVSRAMALTRIKLWHGLGISVSTPYFHGYPGEGVQDFDDIYKLFCQHHSLVSRVQVTHKKMYDVLLGSGIQKEKVHTIRIGIDSSLFRFPTQGQRFKVREKYGIPQAAVVVGSFQKDGVGWGAGATPKLIKGPDILVQTLKRLKETIPELFVLLSGAARGYVIKELESAHVPYRHVFVKDLGEIATLYHALDSYIVSSRQEGGPKAILESMATGIPIISTRVGQATELIKHGENGWLADIGDFEALAAFALSSVRDSSWRAASQLKARKTAEENDCLAQTPLWNKFFDGIVSQC